MAQSVKTVLQNNLINYIKTFAGPSPTSFDPDLPGPLKFCDFGFELYRLDYQQGPGVRLAVINKTLESGTLGGGRQNLHYTELLTLQLIGVTGIYPDQDSADAAASLFEEIIAMHLMTADFSNTESSYTSGGKQSFAQEIRPGQGIFTPSVDPKTDMTTGQVILKGSQIFTRFFTVRVTSATSAH